MAAPTYRAPGAPLSRGQQSAMYFARKRRKARAEGTPALRAQNLTAGVTVLVVLVAV